MDQSNLSIQRSIQKSGYKWQCNLQGKLLLSDNSYIDLEGPQWDLKFDSFEGKNSELQVLRKKGGQNWDCYNCNVILWLN